MKLCLYPSVTENVESNDHCDDAGVVVVVVDNDQISLIVSYIFLYSIRFSGAPAVQCTVYIQNYRKFLSSLYLNISNRIPFISVRPVIQQYLFRIPFISVWPVIQPYLLIFRFIWSPCYSNYTSQGMLIPEYFHQSPQKKQTRTKTK